MEAENRRFSSWERGLLLGAVIGAFLGPSICLLVVVLLFGYDLYGPEMISRINTTISDRLLDKAPTSENSTIEEVPVGPESKQIPVLPSKPAPPPPPPINNPASSSGSSGSKITIPLPPISFNPFGIKTESH